MATTKSPASLLWCSSAALLIVMMGLSTQTVTVRSQQCSAELTNLSVCAQYVVPGQPNLAPSPECCSALQHVDQTCLCNTLRVASQMPSACGLPALSCG
ncbi:hypothetical protein GIB67_028339 [Kingdonia uniflora]|uniref:Bifunctional inhibitor/plant lipid transfer protein/seed storage helical domain-containing protein n=1 Tax=Kingdonia uniflora TaxID=39325 RepID=A0A7J7MHU7_9MAGN|nr:hypothetical protein GIB67_028339 [Kingdonia uniflora]